VKRMDFDIGNILYLVITLVVIIVGLLGKKRKPSPKASEEGEAEDQSRPGFLENLERVLKMDQEEATVMDLRDHEPDLPVEEVEETEQSFQDQTSEQASSKPSFMSEYQQILQRLENREGDVFLTEGDDTGEPLEVIDLDDEEGGTDYFEIVKDFDAGTAVVYSAIINRVDY
jgi:hypothetical protein